MERIYIEVILEEGRYTVWSSSRGRLDVTGSNWKEAFESGISTAGRPGARVMIQLVGDSSKIADKERMQIMDSAKRAGFGVVRIEEGEPMEPETAFELMALPFT